MSESLSERIREVLEEISRTINLVAIGHRSLEQLIAFNNGQNPFGPEFISPIAIAKRAKKKKIKLAKKIFGNQDFFGPAKIKEHFGVELSWEQVPEISFSEEELIRAKKLNQALILGIEELADSSPATMSNLYKLCQPKFDKLRAGKALYSALGTGWYNKSGEEQEFFIKDVSKLKWRLVSKEKIKNSLGVNYLEQTQALADYLINEVFAGQTMSEKYQQAIAEFNSQKDELGKLMKDNNYDRPLVAKRLSELKINQLCRRTPVEAFYDFLIYFLSNKERLLENYYDWTNRLDSNGYLVVFGNCDANGARVNDNPDSSSGNLGVCLSRSGDL